MDFLKHQGQFYLQLGLKGLKPGQSFAHRGERLVFVQPKGCVQASDRQLGIF
jgi:hypothetical protein